MKYLFLSLSLLIPSLTHADTITSGSVGLLIISTGPGVIDSTRNWADKLNGNNKIVAASMTTIISQINNIATDTTTLLSVIKTTAVQVSNLQASYSTTAMQLANLQVSYSTSLLIGGNTNYATNQSTTTLFSQLNSSAVQLSNYITSDLISASTTGVLIGKLLTTDSTTSVRIDQHQVTFTTISAYLSNGALAVYDEGAVIGNATTINCSGSGIVCSQSGSTTTVTVAGGGGGASGPSTSTTRMTWNSDLFISTVVGSNPAHYSDTVSTLNISAAWAEISIPSTYTTCSSTWTLYSSTGSQGGGQIIMKYLVGFSSFTMDYSQQVSTTVYIPAVPVKVNAFTHLYVVQTSDPATCGPPPRGEIGIKMRTFLDP